MDASAPNPINDPPQHQNHLNELPLALISEVVGFLDGKDKALLRAVNRLLKSVTDRHITKASWLGLASDPAPLPETVQQVEIVPSGPVTRQWIVDSLSHVQQLKSFHCFSRDAWEPVPLKEGRRSAKPTAAPGCLAALPDLLGMARLPAPSAASAGPSTSSPASGPAGGHLTSLLLLGVGTSSIRRLRDRDMRLLMSGMKEQPADAGHGLHTFGTPYDLNIFRSFLQGLGHHLVNLRSLYLECGFWRMCGHYATHELSRLTALTHLSFRGADDMLVSHLMPLYLITSLKSLDLSLVQLQHAEDSPLDPIFSAHFNPMDQPLHNVDTATAAVLTDMAQLNGWHVGQAPVYPVKALLQQLGRCTNLTSLNLRDMLLPWEHTDMHGDAQLSDMLGPLTGLQALDLSLVDDEEQTREWMIEGLSGLTSLTRLELDQADEVSTHGTALVAALKDKVFPHLRHVSLLCLAMDDLQLLEDLATLTQVTHLELGGIQAHLPDADDHFAPAPILNSVLDRIGGGLKHLGLSGWPLYGPGVARACPSLTSLDISRSHMSFMDIDMAATRLPNSSPDDGVWRHLPLLNKLACWNTGFSEDSLRSVLRHCPKLTNLETGGAHIDGDQLMLLIIALRDTGSPQGSGAPVDAGPAFRHTALTSLVLDQQQPRLSDAAIRRLPRVLPSLVRLSLRDSNLGLGAWLALGLFLPHLRVLHTGGAGVTDAHLVMLGEGRVSLDDPAVNNMLDDIFKGGDPRSMELLSFFPTLRELEVTDDRLHGGHLTRAGVDALAAGVAAGTCSLRELRVHEPGDHGPGNGGGGGPGPGPNHPDSDSSFVTDDEGGSESSYETVGSGDGMEVTEAGASGEGAGGVGQEAMEVEGGVGGEEEEGGEEGEGEGGSSDWEEVVPGQDEEVDAVVEEKAKAERRPRILQQAHVAGWLRQGLLVRHTPLAMEEEEARARSWLREPEQ